MRSTAEWEAALEGTTPGPWWTETQPRLRYANGETWEEIGDILICSDAELTPLMSLPEQYAEDEEQGPNNLANAKLAALAPEAVSEVVRLRRELAKVGEVLARLDREYATVADSNPRPGRDEYAAGYLAGIDTAYTWLQKALEDTNE